jgi:hypothetical protein
MEQSGAHNVINDEIERINLKHTVLFDKFTNYFKIDDFSIFI